MFTPSEDIAKAISEITININNTYITSKVIYIRSTNISNGIRSAYQFDKLSDSDREYITQTCLKKQIEERRKNLK